MRRLTKNDLRRLIREELIRSNYRNDELNEGIFSWLGQKARDFLTRKERELFDEFRTVIGKGDIQDILNQMRRNQDFQHWIINILHSRLTIRSYDGEKIMETAYRGQREYFNWKFGQNWIHDGIPQQEKDKIINYRNKFIALSDAKKAYWSDQLTNLIQQQHDTETYKGFDAEQAATVERSAGLQFVGVRKSNFIRYIRANNIKNIFNMDSRAASTFLIGLLWNFSLNFYVTPEEHERNTRRDTTSRRVIDDEPIIYKYPVPRVDGTFGFTRKFIELFNRMTRGPSDIDKYMQLFFNKIPNINDRDKEDLKFYFNEVSDGKISIDIREIKETLQELLNELNKDFRHHDITGIKESKPFSKGATVRRFTILSADIRIIIDSQQN